MKRWKWRSSAVLALVALAPFLIANTADGPRPARPARRGRGRSSEERSTRGLLAFLLAAGLVFAVLELGLFVEEAAAPAQPAQPGQDGAAAFSVGSLPAPRSAGALLQPRDAPGGELPPRLRELVGDPKLSSDLRTALAKNNFSDVDPSDMAELPIVLALHISAPFLATCAPSALGAMVRQRPSDAVLARAVLSAVDLLDDAGRTHFIKDLGFNSDLSAEVQSIIGEAAVRWWAKDMPEHSADLVAAGSPPLLANLPPGYLAELPPDHASNMLMRLRDKPWGKSPNDPAWSSLPPETKRVWMELFKKDPKSGRGQLISPASDGLNMLWAGATPDEINDLQYNDNDKESLVRLMHLTKLQVRGFLAKLFPSAALSAVDLNDVHRWLMDFSPAGLQRFQANDTDLTNLRNIDPSGASVPTLKQALEQVLASMVMQDRIEYVTDPGSWGRSIKDLGHLVHLIRADQLKRYSDPGRRLPHDVLAAIDTYKLSALQARYLTRNGEFLDLNRPLSELEAYHGLTRAIPTGRLAALRAASTYSKVVLHLIESIPASHAGRSAVLLNKERAPLFVETPVLEAVLRNPEPGQYLSLVSAREVDAERDTFERTFAALLRRMSLGGLLKNLFDPGTTLKDDIEKHLGMVPLDTLSAVLGSARRDLGKSRHPYGNVWNADSLLSPERPLVRGALLGLTCADVFTLDLPDLPVILYEFNTRLRAAGLMFPKRLQYCLQRAMEDYLDMKKLVRRGVAGEALVDFLEPSDIEAFGGFVLATIRPNHIVQAPHAGAILSAIGALSPRELLAAMRNEDGAENRKPPLGYATEFALQVVDLFGARRSVGPRCLFAMGNLHMFLPADVISAIEPAAWKLFVEAAAGRPQSLAVCANGEQRDAWHRLIIKTFGSPSRWSAGVVAALGDVLAVLPADVLASIRLSSWKEAADTLAQRTGYHLPTEVHGSDYPLPFVDVCRSLLQEGQQAPFYWQVRRLSRYYLRAAQAQMDSVERAEQLVRRLKQRSARVRHPAFTPRHAGDTTTTSTTLSTSTATAETPTSEQSATPSTSTTTTTEDPFFDFDQTNTPDWMIAVLTSTSKPGPPPKTIIVQDDNGPADAAEATTTPPADATGTTALTSVGTGKDLLVAWDEARDKMAILSANAPTSTVTSSSVTADRDIPQAATLPSMFSYPNRSQSDSGAGIQLSNTTIKYAETTEVAAKSPQVSDLALDNPVRRRRGADDFSEEMEHQIERDVPVVVTCDAVRTLGEAASLALVQTDSEHMLDVEAEDCLEDLARLRLGRKLTRQIWLKLSPFDRSERLGDLGRLVSALAIDEVATFNLSLSHPDILDVLSVISRNVHNEDVMEAVGQQLELQNPSLRAVAGGGGEAHADGPGLPGLDADSLLVALGPLACKLPLDVQRLLLSRRGALLHAAHGLQTGRFHCNDTCLVELARAAASGAALGPLDTWTAEDVRHLGVIVAGLSAEQLRQLQRPADYASFEHPLSGLTASAVTCMTPDQILAIGDDLDKLSSVAASAVNPVQHNDLASHQFANLIRVRHNIFTRQLGRPGGHGRPDGGAGSKLAVSQAALILGTLAALTLGAGSSL